MKKNSEKPSFAGRAKTVLVYKQGREPLAFISSVVVRASDDNKQGRIHFVGPVSFDQKIADHLSDVILPASDIIFNGLQLPLKCFKISIVNLEVTSMRDVGSVISGFSADAPIFLAILSAALQIEIPEDIVSTGHIASIDGDIRMVSSIPAKLSAAVKNKSVHTFIYPDIDQDDSLDSLSPQQKSHISGALAKAKSDLHVVSVQNVKDLLSVAFSDKQIVRASLRYNFYNSSANLPQPYTSLESATDYLLYNNEKRFWSSLEQYLFSGQDSPAKELLKLFAEFYLSRKIYPKGFGSRLLKLLHSIPPFTLNHKIVLPLLAMAHCIQLSQLARETDHEDVGLLITSTSTGTIRRIERENKKKKIPDESKDIDGKLQSFLTEIDEDTLLRLIRRPIDTARATFSLSMVTTNSADEFNELITSFYVHLIRHAHRLSEPVDPTTAGKYAFELLEHSFIKKGGISAARAEAETGLNGGIRVVLDIMTEQFKQDQQESYLRYILKIAFDPLKWDEKVSLIRAFLKRLEHNLPAEIVSQPEKYVEHFNDIVKSYILSQDRLKAMLLSY